MSTLEWSPARSSHSGNGDASLNGVALAIHGLNYHPPRMQPIVDCLNTAGVDCLVLSMHGHGDNYLPRPDLDEDASRLCSFTRVTYRLWTDEVIAAYTIARRRADAHNVPLLISGLSLGGLMACVVPVTRPEIRVDRLLLFAPALALPPHGFQYWLAERAPRRVLPSLSPQRYRANRGTPGAAYAAAYTALAELHDGDLQRLNIPGLVFVDRKDEVISSEGVESIASQIPKWECIPVNKSNGKNGRVYHHLIVGEEAVGQDAWREISTRITRFVSAPS